MKLSVEINNIHDVILFDTEEDDDDAEDEQCCCDDEPAEKTDDAKDEEERREAVEKLVGILIGISNRGPDSDNADGCYCKR